MQELAQRCAAVNWRVVDRKRGWMVFPADGQEPVRIPSQGAGRTVDNVTTELRKRGLEKAEQAARAVRTASRRTKIAKDRASVATIATAPNELKEPPMAVTATTTPAQTATPSLDVGIPLEELGDDAIGQFWLRMEVYNRPYANLAGVAMKADTSFAAKRAVRYSDEARENEPPPSDVPVCKNWSNWCRHEPSERCRKCPCGKCPKCLLDLVPARVLCNKPGTGCTLTYTSSAAARKHLGNEHPGPLTLARRELQAAKVTRLRTILSKVVEEFPVEMPVRKRGTGEPQYYKKIRGVRLRNGERYFVCGADRPACDFASNHLGRTSGHVQTNHHGEDETAGAAPVPATTAKPPPTQPTTPAPAVIKAAIAKVAAAPREVRQTTPGATGPSTTSPSTPSSPP
ncbi:hypothetical protein I0C86_40430, partial [Plantactinospora sp. S1510]|nr:hypothetical protein [Plantactinospora alkalitolerans]